MKKLLLNVFAACCLSLSAADKLVFFCDFSDGFTPQVSAQPCDILPDGAEIVQTEQGKALRYGKKPDGKLANLIYRLKDSVQPENLSERNLPWPLKYGRMEFRFKTVDWKFGVTPPHTFLDMTGPLSSLLHVYYIYPNGKAALQVAYGQDRNPNVKKGQRTSYYPLIPLQDKGNQWHTVKCSWNPQNFTMEVDGQKMTEPLKYLAEPKQKFYLDQLRIGFYSPVRLKGLTDITDIKFYATAPEK